MLNDDKNTYIPPIQPKHYSTIWMYLDELSIYVFPKVIFESPLSLSGYFVADLAHKMAWNAVSNVA